MGKFNNNKNGFKKLIGFDELFTVNLWKAVLGEAIVSCLYIFIVCGQLVPLNKDMPVSRFQGAMTVALSIACLASAFWEVSGGHFNPIVSLAMLLLKKISLSRFAIFVVAQLLGGQFVLFCSIYLYKFFYIIYFRFVKRMDLM